MTGRALILMIFAASMALVGCASAPPAQPSYHYSAVPGSQFHASSTSMGNAASGTGFGAANQSFGAPSSTGGYNISADRIGAPSGLQGFQPTGIPPNMVIPH